MLIIHIIFIARMHQRFNGHLQIIRLQLEQKALYGWTKPSYANYTTNEDYYYAFNAFAEYSKSFLENTHNFKIMAGYNQEKKSNKNIMQNVPI